MPCSVGGVGGKAPHAVSILPSMPTPVFGGLGGEDANALATLPALKGQG